MPTDFNDIIVNINPAVFEAIEKDDVWNVRRMKGLNKPKTRIISRLGEALKVNAGTVRHMLRRKDIRLTTPTAVLILEDELKMKGKVLDISYRFTIPANN